MFFLGRDTKTDERLWLPEAQSCYIVGNSQMGKSELLLQLTLQLARSTAGVCLIDPHGDLSKRDLLPLLPDSLADDERLVWLDGTDLRHPFGLNPYACDPADLLAVERTVSYTVEVFKKLWPRETSVITPEIDAALARMSRTLIDQRGTLLDADRILGQTKLSQWAAPIRSRIHEFTDNRIVQRIIGQSSSTVNIGQLLTEGKIVLVHLPVGTLGGQTVNILGSLLVGQVLEAMMLRAEQTDRPPCYLIVDEFHRIATTAFADIFTQPARAPAERVSRSRLSTAQARDLYYSSRRGRG